MTSATMQRADSRGAYQSWGKRTLDLLISLPISILLAPLAAIIGGIIRCEDGDPAIFRQARVGASGSTFTLFKFRTMPAGSKQLPSARAGELQVTRVGRVLRRTSLDEIPQLVSVLRGDMTLVGPRPALASQTELLRLREVEQADTVRPGLTGLAQVNSYDGMPEDEKARWDGEYARNVSLRTDLWILLRTFGYLTRKPPQY